MKEAVAYTNGEWSIPETYQATPRQVKCAKFIESVLGLSSPPPVRSALWVFIHDNLQKALDVVQHKNYC